MTINSPTDRFENAPEEKVVKSWAGGAIRIVKQKVKQFDVKLDREVEYADVLGVRIPRRNPSADHYPGKPDQFLPGFNGDPREFEALTFKEPDIELLKAAMMRNAIGHHTDFRGYPGHGKSTMIHFLAYLLNVPIRRVSCKKGMKVIQEFLWKFAKNGEWDGRLGPLPLSMEEGGILLIDEFANLEPHERQLVLEPTESPNLMKVFKRVPTLNIQDYPGKETTIIGAPGFQIFATGNYSAGQGVGEISPHTEREERRVRPYLLGRLPTGTKAARLAGRYLDTDARDSDTMPEGMTPTEYYPKRLDIPASVIKIIAHFFEAVEKTIETEVLGQNIRQDPKVYLTEAIDRSFDHFMRFQIMKNGGVKEGSNSMEALNVREAEIVDSLIAALEFYYLNSFREDTMMTVPDALEEDLKREVPDAIVNNKRIAVKTYLAWRFRHLFKNVPLFQHGAAVVTTQERLNTALKEAMGIASAPPPPPPSPDEGGNLAEDIEREIDDVTSLLGSTPPSASPETPPGELPEIIHSPESYADMTPEQIHADLEKQYNARLQTMRYFGIIDRVDNPQVTCIDEVRRKAPTHEEIWRELSRPENSAKMEAVKTLKKPKLIVTPIGMSMETLADKVGSQNGRMKIDGQVLEQNPVFRDSWDINSDKTGEMKYFPNKYKKENHGGKTKQELLDADSSFPGWQVVFVDGEQEVKDVNKDAPTFLAQWQEKNYAPLTTEEIMMLHTEGVVSPFGDENEAHPHNRSRFEWALGSYMPEMQTNGVVPHVSWAEGNRRLRLHWYNPAHHRDNLGPRRAVRVF